MEQEAWTGSVRSRKNWTSQPELSLFVEGKNLFANVRYKGLPLFKQYAGEPTVVKVHGADLKQEEQLHDRVQGPIDSEK
jgi:hypothetical protein